MASEVIWAHNQWGESENWHKELKACLEMGADAVGEFAANAMYFAIGVLAYNLAQRLKRQVLPESYRTATVATLPWKLYRLVAKLVRHARDRGLQIKADLEKWQLLAWGRLACARPAGRLTKKGANPKAEIEGTTGWCRRGSESNRRKRGHTRQSGDLESGAKAHRPKPRVSEPLTPTEAITTLNRDSWAVTFHLKSFNWVVT